MLQRVRVSNIIEFAKARIRVPATVRDADMGRAEIIVFPRTAVGKLALGVSGAPERVAPIRHAARDTSP